MGSRVSQMSWMMPGTTGCNDDTVSCCGRLLFRKPLESPEEQNYTVRRCCHADMHVAVTGQPLETKLSSSARSHDGNTCYCLSGLQRLLLFVPFVCGQSSTLSGGQQ